MKWYEVMLLSLGWYKGGLTVKPGGKTPTHFTDTIQIFVLELYMK